MFLLLVKQAEGILARPLVAMWFSVSQACSWSLGLVPVKWEQTHPQTTVLRFNCRNKHCTA